jgi:hypothetical protein
MENPSGKKQKSASPSSRSSIIQKIAPIQGAR